MLPLAPISDPDIMQYQRYFKCNFSFKKCCLNVLIMSGECTVYVNGKE